jgi:2'-5' RNA ligase
MAGRVLLGSPSDRSAVIVRVQLPAALERLRRDSIGNAADGVPAHATLLYPFVAPDRLTAEVRGLIAGVAAEHDAFDFSLAGAAQWPETVYVRLEPAAPFVRLQAALARTFPAFPIYGPDADVAFVPHVSVAEGSAAKDPRTIGETAWAALPRPGRASAMEVIARGPGGRWRTVWRIGLGRRPRSAAR